MSGVVVEYVARVGLAAAGLVTLCVLARVALRSPKHLAVVGVGVLLAVVAAVLPAGARSSSAAVPWPYPSPRPTTHQPVPRPSYTPSPRVPPVRPSVSRGGVYVPSGTP